MHLGEYLEKRKVTDNVIEDDTRNILHMIIGLLTEIDEIMVCKPYEATDELGDIYWYIYKPLSVNANILNTFRKFNKLHDIDTDLSLREIKSKALDSYKKVRYQEHKLNVKRKDGYTHLQVFKILLKACIDIAQNKASIFGLSRSHILAANIRKLSKRYDDGEFNKKLSMQRVSN